MESGSIFARSLELANVVFQEKNYQSVIELCNKYLMKILQKQQSSNQDQSALQELQIMRDKFQNLLYEARQKLDIELGLNNLCYKQQIPKCHFSDIIGNQKAIAHLKERVMLPLKFPDLFKNSSSYRNQPLFLYGFSGTGKTLAVRALINELCMPMFSIPISTLLKYNESDFLEKVQSLFKQARENKPSIIFMDQIEDLFNRDQGSASDIKSQIITELFVQLHNLENDLIFISETSFPHMLDCRAFRYLGYRIQFDEPSNQDKLLFLKKQLPKDANLSDKDIEEISENSPNYTLYDLSILCKEAAMQPVRFVSSADTFKLNSDGLYQPTNSIDPEGQEIALSEIELDKLCFPKVSKEDVQEARSKVKGSISEVDREKMKKFVEQYAYET